ncbi:Hypothetical protein Ccan_03330 [Capnocytophaga canimorsus Cc5]|uniref:Uncharacterized protein n=1 Tax=Capnocytophaga canimorsus (strain 5) TaxID=860228 RepID=F9YR97_CAPCC|nr:Hypothetical protein Ccan_03330 [Capnocytophaga canimorsus Cc5]
MFLSNQIQKHKTHIYNLLRKMLIHFYAPFFHKKEKIT